MADWGSFAGGLAQGLRSGADLYSQKQRMTAEQEEREFRRSERERQALERQQLADVFKPAAVQFGGYQAPVGEIVIGGDRLPATQAGPVRPGTAVPISTEAFGPTPYAGAYGQEAVAQMAPQYTVGGRTVAGRPEAEALAAQMNMPQAQMSRAAQVMLSQGNAGQAVPLLNYQLGAENAAENRAFRDREFTAQQQALGQQQALAQMKFEEDVRQFGLRYALDQQQLASSNANAAASRALQRAQLDAMRVAPPVPTFNPQTGEWQVTSIQTPKAGGTPTVISVPLGAGVVPAGVAMAEIKAQQQPDILGMQQSGRAVAAPKPDMNSVQLYQRLYQENPTNANKLWREAYGNTPTPNVAATQQRGTRPMAVDYTNPAVYRGYLNPGQ
jgi:hypothetical protein